MEEIKKIFEEVSDRLSPRERDVMRLRLGLDDGRRRFPEELAELFGTEPVDIEQTEKSAISKAPEQFNEINKMINELMAYRKLGYSICHNDIKLRSDFTELKTILIELLKNHLTEQEAQVLSLIHGLDGNDKKSLREAGKIMNLSGERVRQIEGKALRKLRHPDRCKTLKAFYDRIEAKQKESSILNDIDPELLNVNLF